MQFWWARLQAVAAELSVGQEPDEHYLPSPKDYRYLYFTEEVIYVNARS